MSTPPIFPIETRAVIIARGVQPPPFGRNSTQALSPIVNSGIQMPAPTVPVSTTAAQSVVAVPSTPNLVISEPNMGGEDSQHDSDALPNYIVMVICLLTEVTAARTCGRPPTSKKTQSTRMSKDIHVDQMSACEIINAGLTLHELDDQYKGTKEHFPPFKMWFTGISGGKATAPTISSEKDLALLVSQLAASKKKPDEITVFIAFDVDDLDAYWVRKRGRDNEPALAGPSGTKVPRLGNMDVNAVLHGDFILKLKAQHKCEEHRGEHGEPGYCYVWPNGQHLGLNNRRLAMWAAAMAAGEATRHAPPNVPEFDGPQGSGAVMVKPRGRVAAAPAVPTSGTDAASLLITAMVPLLATLTQSVVGQNSTAPSAPLPPQAPNPPPNPTPSTSALPAALVPAPNGPSLHLPFTFEHTHMCDCIVDFLDESGIDLMDKLEALKHRDLTPDLLLQVPYDHLGGLLGLSVGKAIMFQIFCRRWVHTFKVNMLGKVAANK